MISAELATRRASPEGLSESTRFWTAGAIVVGTAFIAVFINSPGWYIADARFELYWAPAQFISRHQWIWDNVRGLGRSSPFFSPVIGTFLATLHELNISPAAGERILHGTYLAIAGLGMVQVLRLFRPRLRFEHTLAALVYMFSPFTAQFLVPSGLFLHYAIAPWLLTAFVRGVRADRWRWAAVFALFVLTVGGLNAPTLVYAALPIVPTTLYLVVVERSLTVRAVGGYLGRMLLLTLLISTATLVYLRYNISGFAENLGRTELPKTVSTHSSWSETWRGLGNWLTYFSSATGSARPESVAYFTNPFVIGATFTVPAIAIATVWRSRWRPRLVFAAIALVGLVTMVGLYPVNNLTPAGQILNFAYNHSLLARSFRDTYKAGSSLGIGVSALFAVGVGDALRWIGQRVSPAFAVRIRSAVLVVVLITIGFASFPFWTGNLYSQTDRVTSIPGYWRSALAWLNHRPGDGRVLLLPGTTRTRYRWGYVGDDIFDALLTRPHLVNQAPPQGSPAAANLLAALDNEAISRSYVPGAVSGIARRLGVRWIAVRNDIAWETTGAPRPSQLDGLRRDPSLKRVATFGRKGQDVATPSDSTARRLGETTLPPVEVYEVRDSQPIVQLLAAQPPLLVSGDGDAWPALAQDGLLTNAGPVRYTAMLSTPELEQSISAGVPVVITDTNRRRVTQAITARNVVSHTLSAGENLTRAAGDLFHRAGSQSVATFADATRIVASRYGNTVIDPFQTWLRPANAFDADPNTGWLVAGLQNPVGNWVRVDFKRPVRIGRVDLTRVSTGGRRITSATLRFSDGSQVPVRFGRGQVSVNFRPRTTRSLEVRIRAVVGLASAVGFSDISVPGLNLTETIAAPTDLASVATRSRTLRRKLADAPMTFAFQRVIGNGASDVELALHRRFQAIDTHAYQVRGVLRLDSSTPSDARSLVRSGALDQAGCTRSLLSIDGQPLPLRLNAGSASLNTGNSVGFEGCAPVLLTRGSHRLDSNPGADGLISTVDLSTNPMMPASASPSRGTIRILSASPTRVSLRVKVPTGGYLIIGQSFSAAWRATAGGRDLGSPVALNTSTGWQLPRTNSVDVVASYQPQRLWEVALATTGGTTALCVWLVVTGGRRRRRGTT